MIGFKIITVKILNVNCVKMNIRSGMFGKFLNGLHGNYLYSW